MQGVVEVTYKDPELRGEPYDHEAACQGYMRAWQNERSVTVVAAAVLQDDRIWTGKRHSDIMLVMLRAGKEDAVQKDQQGFITNTGLYVRRPAAKNVAIKSGQIPKDFKGILQSRDLW